MQEGRRQGSAKRGTTPPEEARQAGPDLRKLQAREQSPRVLPSLTQHGQLEPPLCEPHCVLGHAAVPSRVGSLCLLHPQAVALALQLQARLGAQGLPVPLPGHRRQWPPRGVAIQSGLPALQHGHAREGLPGAGDLGGSWAGNTRQGRRWAPDSPALPGRGTRRTEWHPTPSPPRSLAGAVRRGQGAGGPVPAAGPWNSAHRAPPAAGPGCCSRPRYCTRTCMSPPVRAARAPGTAVAPPRTPAPHRAPPRAAADLWQ